MDGNECRGGISSDPDEKSPAVSKTKTGPCTSPTTSRVSAEANARMFGVAGANDRDLLGVNTVSALSGVAAESAARRSAKGEKIKAGG